jgi:hypothetical protein
MLCADVPQPRHAAPSALWGSGSSAVVRCRSGSHAASSRSLRTPPGRIVLPRAQCPLVAFSWAAAAAAITVGQLRNRCRSASRCRRPAYLTCCCKRASLENFCGGGLNLEIANVSSKPPQCPARTRPSRRSTRGRAAHAVLNAFKFKVQRPFSESRVPR